MSLHKNDSIDSREASSDNEGEYSDKDFTDPIDLEADKNRIVEHSPKGRFIRFNEELGSGAYKTVYKAYDNETGYEVAWNVIRLPNLHAKDRKRISDEIGLLKKLKHPNIIQFISAWLNKQKEEIVFITEVVTGGSLKKYLKKIKRPRLKVIKSWCKEILQGIEYLHTLKPHPIIHRDIKCDNIFINSNKGEIRIGDLGLATFMSNAYAASVLGTPEFMAPEMYEEVYGPSVDIYSFGMCVLEMVTNQTPYRECMNPAQIYKKVINGIKPAALDLILNEDVKQFIVDCLKSKDERPSVSELMTHRFLQVIDQDSDNQPVSLIETPEDKLEEEKTMIQKEKPSRLENEGVVEKSHRKQSKDISYHGEPAANEKSRINKHEETTKPAALSRKSSDCLGQEEKPKDLLFVSPPLGKFKSLQNMNTASNNITLEKRTTEETTKPDTFQQDKSDLTQDQQQPLNISEKKEHNKFNFQSKGIINGNLVIILKIETQGNQYEHIITIRRDKISQEKITKKILKRLGLPLNHSDAYFVSQIKVLFESIDYLNNSTSIHNTVFHPITSTMSINARSPSQANFESHLHHEKTLPIYSQLFVQAYQNYLLQLPKEQLHHETEEAMSLRQQGELLELQNRHLMQRRSLWDRKHNILSNSTLNVIGQKSHSVENDEIHNKLHQIYENNYKPHGPKMRNPGTNNFFFSPLNSSGALSPMTSCGNVSSANNSVEIMASLLKKLGNIADDQNKSISHQLDTLSENDRFFRSNLVSPNNQELVTRAVSDKTGDVFKFPNQVLQRNPSYSSQISVNQQTPSDVITPNNMISPRALTGMTSPKDITSAILSPKGLRNFAPSPQNIRGSPRKMVNEKGEVIEKKSEIQPLAVINEKIESIRPQISSPQNIQNIHLELPKTPSFQEKMQEKVEKASTVTVRDLEAKKGSKYGSLTINTEIVNQTDKKIDSTKAKSMNLPDESQPQTKKHNTDQEVKNLTPNSQSSKLDIQDNHNKTEAQKHKRTSLAEELHHKSEKTPPNPVKNVGENIPEHKIKEPGQKNQSPPQILQFGHNKSPTTNEVSNPFTSMQADQNASKKVNEPLLTVKSPKAEDKILIGQHKAPSPQVLGNKEQESISPPKNLENLGASFSTYQNNFAFTFAPQQEIYHKEISGANKIEESKGHTTPVKPKNKLEALRIVKSHKFKSPLGKHVNDIESEDLKIIEWALELLLGQEVCINGQPRFYVESMMKTCQEKKGVPSDGILTQVLWDKMLFGLEKVEKSWLVKETTKQKLINDLTTEREELKKKIKDKQNKEASESLNKIESKLLDMSRLMD